MEIHVLAMLGCLSVVSACIVDKEYKSLTLDDLVTRLDVIVYGKVTSFTHNKFTDATFQVYCVIKGDTRVLENITIEAVSPRSACSGTYIYWVNVTSNFEDAGAVMVLGLQETKTPGVYTFHEVNDLQSSAFDDSPETWKLMNRVVTSEMFPPINAADPNRCPAVARPTDPPPNEPPVAEGQGDRGGAAAFRPEVTTTVAVLAIGYMFYGR